MPSHARAVHVYAMAAVLGLVAYLVVYGPGHLSGASAYWATPQPDERMALMGYRYFLHEPWHWPVFVSHAVNVPYAKSVAFLDCIPLWALVNKSLATIVPPWSAFSEHAYLGLWHAICYALQACFGVAILRALGHRSWRAAVVAAVFFLALPTWIFRYSHPALSAHWIVLWALCLYLRTPPKTPLSPRIGRVMLYQLVVAGLVNPYHAALSLGLFVVAVLRSRDRRSLMIWIPLGLAAVVVASWFAGYFAHETVRPQWGFEYESTNLVSWLVPVHSGMFGDLRGIVNVDGTPWQYEGYAYLGIGVLALLAAIAPHARDVRPVIARHAFLFALVVACCVFALSNHVYFASHEVLHYPIPSFLEWVPRQFRSPGRFVWLPTYVLLAFVLSWALTRFHDGRRFAVLVVLMVLQIVDSTGDWAQQRAFTQPQPELVDQRAWRPLIAAHDALFILPPYGCVSGEDGPSLDAASRDLQWLASERGLPINGTYSARAMRWCAAEERAWPTLELHPGELYVLLPRAAAVAERFQASGGHCAAFAYGRVCSQDEGAIAEAIRAGALR